MIAVRIPVLVRGLFMGWKKRGWLVIGVLCGLVACSESIPRVDNRSHSAFSQSAGQNTSPARIVLVMKSPTNPYFSELANGASRAQLETGIDLPSRGSAPSQLR